MKKLKALLVILILNCCGGQKGLNALQLQLVLPGSIPKKSRRFEILKENAQGLELRVQEGASSRLYNYPPSVWEMMGSPSISFPTAEDKIEIEARIHAVVEGKRADLLTGKRTVSQEELKRGTPIDVKLLLLGSVKDIEELGRK